MREQFRQQSPKQDAQKSSPRPRPTTPLLPAVELDEAPKNTWHSPDILQAGLEIERPRSALHSGDFRDEKQNASEQRRETADSLSTSPPAPWAHGFSSAAFKPPSQDDRYPQGHVLQPQRQQVRSRATSQSSLSSSFVLLPPTSPLVNTSNNTDLDFSSKPLSRFSRSPERNSRRHTFSPQSLQAYKTYASDRFPTPPQAPPSLRKEGTFPYQAHQPRRSITSTAQLLQPSSTPHTPRLGTRRPSVGSDTSPLHHAPMVGSYEESILRGRMSTTPSRPLDFVAQIGVLGKGQCKANLRCPPHVTIPFPAVFYSYGSGSSRITDNQPSPYVGLVDIENTLKPLEAEAGFRPRSRRNRQHSPGVSDGHFTTHERMLSPNKTGNLIRQRKLENNKRRSQSPKQLRAPPGGSYRIPPIGQLQIVIKNPHKTAVKLFLVPYDLSDMEPGTKTFIRQRSYSAGPIIDMPISNRNNFGTDRPEASLSNSDDPRERPVLRYLVHLNVCCLGRKGSERYYLHKCIRVVFANRVPDGKERLRNEVQLPEPRYSTYKPTRESNLGINNTPSNLAQDLANRRRSAAISPFDFGRLDAIDGISAASTDSRRPDIANMEWQSLHQPAASLPNYQAGSAKGYSQPPTPALPFSLHKLEPVQSRPASSDLMELDGSDEWRSSTTSFSNSNSNGERRPTSPVSPPGGPNGHSLSHAHSEAFIRNSNGNLELNGLITDSEFQFARSASPFNGMGTTGLLSKRLRNLGDWCSDRGPEELGK